MNKGKIFTNTSAPKPLLTLRAKDAALAGVAMMGTPVETPVIYDAARDAIIGLSETSAATYKLPDDFPAGNYDVYLEISRIASPFIGTSTPVTISVNGGALIVPTMRAECVSPSMAEAGNHFADEMGIFCILENMILQAGNEITVHAIPGLEFFYQQYMSAAPAIGDMHFYKAGNEVEQGYEGNTRKNTAAKKDPDDPLSGLEIGWLGSSVTYGQAGGGYSMADAIEDRHAATHSYKYAVSGTTLAEYHSDHNLPADDGNHGSYVFRMKMIDPKKKFDLFIVQVSTNDATGGVPMGRIAEGRDYRDFDTATVIGAMEYIIKYVSDTWKCPVMFYTGTKYDSEQYGEMVRTTIELQSKWGFGLIDLWNSEKMNAVSEADYAAYMADGIHPNRTGYIEWWTPAFEAGITEYLTR